MKGYIDVYDQRSYYLKQLFIDRGYDIVDSFEKNVDFCFVKNQGKEMKNVFSLKRLNNNHIFRHLNNSLTAMGIYLMLSNQKNVNKVLIMGYGDLGKQLANVLKKRYDITICNRDYKEYKQIVENYQHLDLQHLNGQFDYVINTIPYIEIDYQKLSYTKIIDLAKTCKLEHYQSIRNVPELYFPYESALLMYCFIREEIECSMI